MRIWFTPADLGRVRLATEPDLLWEIMLSSHLLQHRDPRDEFDQWRAAAREILRDPRVRAAAKFLAAVNPRCAYFPDFLTPVGHGADLEAALDTVQSTPRDTLRHELGTLADYAALPAWGRELAEGGTEVLSRLADAIRVYHRALVQPFVPEVYGGVGRDWVGRSTQLAAEGVEGLLADFAPAMRWRAPVLELPFPDGDLYLDGRGLLLVPSYFCDRKPVALADKDLPPVVVYPVRRDAPGPVAAGLTSLLGQTRAAVLTAVGAHGTTGELARRLNLAPSSASEHLRALRDADLLSSTRRGNTVVHALTLRGRALLAYRPTG